MIVMPLRLLDTFLLSHPIAIIVVSIVIISLIFLLYDYMVEQRQKIVLKSAQQSGMLVNTLFPQQVRDQLFPCASPLVDLRAHVVL